jgi:hypothetical protein
LKRWARTKSLRRGNSGAVYKAFATRHLRSLHERNIGIGGYGSRLKAGTTNDFIAASIFKQLSSSGLTGRSSTLRLRGSSRRLWNTGSPAGACHRAARCAGPVAGDDDGGCGHALSAVIASAAKQSILQLGETEDGLLRRKGSSQ